MAKLKSSAVAEVSDFSAVKGMSLCTVVLAEIRAASVRSVTRGEEAAVLSSHTGAGLSGERGWCTRQRKNSFGPCHGAGEVGLMVIWADGLNV